MSPRSPRSVSNAAAYEDVLEDDVALGEVHNLHRVIVDLDRSGHGCLGSSHVSAGEVRLGPLRVSV